MPFKSTLALALAVTLSWDFLWAQPRFEYAPRMFAFSQSVQVVSWEVESAGRTQRLTQTYFPALLRVPLQRSTQFVLAASGALAEATVPIDAQLNGLSDTRLRLSHRFGSDRWAIGAGANFPTGKNLLNFEENQVAALLSEAVLGFPLRRYGAGLDFEFSFSRAFELSDILGLGLGATFVLPGEFQYLEDSEVRYRPGNRFVFTAVLNRLGDAVNWRINTLVQLFATDKQNGENFFRQGQQFEFGGQLQWKFSSQWLSAFHLLQVLKGDNEVFAAAGAALPPESFFVRNSTFLSGGLHRRFGTTAMLGLNLIFNYFGESNLQLDQATIFQVGPTGSVKLSEHWMLNLQANYATGSANDGAIPLRGWNFIFGLQTQI